MVLHALVKWPDLSDKVIRSRIGMRHSPYNSAKIRLKDLGYYRRCHVPNFPKIGFELLLVTHGLFIQKSTRSEGEQVTENPLQLFTEDIYHVSESGYFLSLTISENFTQYMKNFQDFTKETAKNDYLSLDQITSRVYPFALSIIWTFLDFEDLLTKHLSGFSETNSDRRSISSIYKQKSRLSNTEKKCLIGFIIYPEGSDHFLSKKINVSRTTISQTRKKFLDQRLCVPRVIPNLHKLGFKFLALTFYQLHPSITENQGIEASALIRHHLAPHIYVSCNNDGFLLSAHSSLEEFDQVNNELIQWFMKNEYTIDEPVTHIISIPDMTEWKDFNFEPLMLKLFDTTPHVDLL
jgi:hypothetical protein